MTRVTPRKILRLTLPNPYRSRLCGTTVRKVVSLNKTVSVAIHTCPMQRGQKRFLR